MVCGGASVWSAVVAPCGLCGALSDYRALRSLREVVPWLVFFIKFVIGGSTDGTALVPADRGDRQDSPSNNRNRTLSPHPLQREGF